MPTKGTTRHAIRIPDDLWTAALTLARSRNENLSDIIRRALTDYIKQQGTK
jgi:predicted transcriptional regulator